MANKRLLDTTHLKSRAKITAFNARPSAAIDVLATARSG